MLASTYVSVSDNQDVTTTLITNILLKMFWVSNILMYYSADCTSAFSYTHLDVYKRQALVYHLGTGTRPPTSICGPRWQLLWLMTNASASNYVIISRKDGKVWDVQRGVGVTSSSVSPWDRNQAPHINLWAPLPAVMAYDYRICKQLWDYKPKGRKGMRRPKRRRSDQL